MTKDEVSEVVKDCFIEIMDKYDLTFRVEVGVATFSYNNYGRIFENPIKLKMASISTKNYYKVINVYFILDNKQSTIKVCKEAIDTSVEKFQLMMESEGYEFTKHVRVKVIRKKQDLNIHLVKSNEMYEYLPIKIESRLVIK